MAKNTENDHAQHDDAHNQHEGSSVLFYIFIALVLGVITYVEFALVEHQDTWFASLSGSAIFWLLIGLSVVKFVMVVMFFMHLQQDDRTFTGFFTSGMVIAVGTLFALSALFTVRSVAAAQTPQQETSEAPAEAHGEAGEPSEASIAHRFEYPAPKTLDVSEIDLAPEGQILAGMSIVGGGGPTQRAANSRGERTAGGIPLATPPAAVTLPDPFAQQPATQQPPAGQPAAQQPAGAAQPAPAGTQNTAPPRAGNAGGGLPLADADVSAGEEIFNTNCASCHQTTGEGIPGAFPPLVGHAPELANAEGGRAYLADLLLYGLQGEIDVSGQTYNGVMAPWAQLSDDDLANVLNYVLSSWGNADAVPTDYPAFAPEDIAAQRDAGLSTQQVYELRQTLNLPLKMTGRWILDPVLIGGLVTLALVYFLLTGPLRQRYAPGAAFPRRKALYFYSAVVLLYLTDGSPLHDLSELYSFSAHMVQHMLLAYIVPAVMLRGLPDWLVRPFLLHPRVKPVAKVLTNPVVTFVVFSVFFSLWHIPVIYEGALTSSLIHHVEHVLFLFTALLLWWPLLSPLPELPRLSHAGVLVYLFLLPIAQLPVFAAVTFADHSLYPTYANSPHVMFGDARMDQTMGGALMKVGGLIAFGLPFIITFFTWYREENTTRYRRRAQA